MKVKMKKAFFDILNGINLITYFISIDSKIKQILCMHNLIQYVKVYAYKKLLFFLKV